MFSIGSVVRARCRFDAVGECEETMMETWWRMLIAYMRL